MMCCNPKFCRGPNLSFFGLGPWAIYYSWYRQIGKYFFLLNMNFDDTIWEVFSKLSENHKIVDIGYTEDPMSKIIGFSESLERDLSNGVLQLIFGALICHFSALDHGLLFMVSPNWQILLSHKYEVWWHHLKGIFLSFQKIIKLLTLDIRKIQCQQF